MTLQSNFAVGCFHFSMEETDDYDHGSYTDAVSAILSGIDNISNISINLSEYFMSFPLNPMPSEDGINGPFNPCPAGGFISFDLFIPHRLQEECFYGERIENCENFSVLISYQHGFPVTLIKPNDSRFIPHEEGFSTSVPIVREFIRSKARTANGVRFACMGPSPFHAEFFIRESKHPETEVLLERRDGYDKVDINLGTSEEVHVAVDSIIRVCSSYYDAIYFKNAASEAEIEAELTIVKALERIT